MGSVKAAKVRIIVMEKKVVDAEKELYEVKTQASEAEGEFREQNEHRHFIKEYCLISNQIRWSNCVASMRQRLTDACHGEVQAISNTKAKIVELEKNF